VSLNKRIVFKTDLYLYNPVVSICTTSLSFNNCTFCPHCMYLFCICRRTINDLCQLQHKLIVFISEKTATCVNYCIMWLVFVTEMGSVYSAVRLGASNWAVSF